VDPVPDPLLLRKLVLPGIEPETSGSVDAVEFMLNKTIILLHFVWVRNFDSDMKEEHKLSVLESFGLRSISEPKSDE
jgi:hypothetical protein